MYKTGAGSVAEQRKFMPFDDKRRLIKKGDIMTTILMSIKPVYVGKIFNGTKKYEFRKTRCKNVPSRIIVYSSAPVKKVVGELIIDEVLFDDKEVIWNKTNIYGGIVFLPGWA